MILYNEKEKHNRVGAKQLELDEFVNNKGQHQFSKLKSDQTWGPGVKNAINYRTCGVYSRAAWKEVLSWQARFDKILPKVTNSCDLWLNLEKDKKTCPCEEVEKLAFLIIDERPILTAEEISKVWIDGFLLLVTMVSDLLVEGMHMDDCSNTLDNEHSFKLMEEKLEKLELDGALVAISAELHNPATLERKLTWEFFDVLKSWFPQLILVDKDLLRMGVQFHIS
ncbi:hypothetical protein HAX54_017859 [Datura stramonium]|uniref:Uncharacterized protein n=1 Tax=Datura stramonium TaxID=4076 RepID=A0ABS8UNH5_DATST|nr:hypothetical protein [Datura stramonium]